MWRLKTCLLPSSDSLTRTFQSGAGYGISNDNILSFTWIHMSEECGRKAVSQCSYFSTLGQPSFCTPFSLNCRRNYAEEGSEFKKIYNLTFFTKWQALWALSWRHVTRKRMHTLHALVVYSLFFLEVIPPLNLYI